MNGSFTDDGHGLSAVGCAAHAASTQAKRPRLSDRPRRARGLAKKVASAQSAGSKKVA